MTTSEWEANLPVVPAAADNAVARDLRDQLTELKRDAAERWASFERYRAENEESLKKNVPDVWNEAERRHEAYAEKANEAKIVEKNLSLIHI